MGDAAVMQADATRPLLEVRDLRTTFATHHGEFRAVDGVSFSVDAGRTIGIVGESGCGKSVTALSIMRLVPTPPGRIAGGAVLFEGEDLLKLPIERMQALRGDRIAMIFQEPMTSLNPVFTVGEQITEGILRHRDLSRDAAKTMAVDMLRRVRIPSPDKRYHDYPHRLSGGMRQRVMIAMALACGPRLLIADEPTTALDVTIQAQILDLMRMLREETGTAIALITHDLGVVAEVADDIVVMYAGRIVERASVGALFAMPQHPYTIGLLGSIPQVHLEQSRLAAIEGQVPNPLAPVTGCAFHPRCPFATARCREAEPPLVDLGGDHHAACWHTPLSGGQGQGPKGASPRDGESGRQDVAADLPHPRGGRPARIMTGPLLRAERLTRHFPVREGFFGRARGHVHAVDDVSFAIDVGETLALVGESGCGKSTAGRLLLRLIDADRGHVWFDGVDLVTLDDAAMRAKRRELQIIFQDPYASLNPRMTVRQTLAEPLALYGLATGRRDERVAELLALVGLAPHHAERYPHEFSGGQRQRIGIARALAVEPRVIVCDEPVSALDVSIQAQVINLLQDLQRRLGLAYVFIAHDLAVVKHIATSVAVMYLGQIVEHGDKRAVFAEPRHPYTQALLSAIPLPVPSLARRRILLPGDVPSPIDPPPGCRFRTRCIHARERCAEETPALEAQDGHAVACHFWREIRGASLATALPPIPPNPRLERLQAAFRPAS